MTGYRKIATICCAAVFALGLAACGGGGGPATEPPPDPAIEQRAAIDTAIGTAETRVAAVNNDSTDAVVSAAEATVAAATAAIAAAANVPVEEKAANTRTVTALANRLTAAKEARQTAMDDADKAANMAMMATAMKLHAGISAPGGSGEDMRTAAYGTGDDADKIAVTIGAAEAVNLSEDKKATVAANRGWEGKKYTRTTPAAGGMYEAVVYSNVGMPTKGKKFGSPSADDDYEYILDATNNTELTINTDEGGVAARVASPSFDQSAGRKEFKTGENQERVPISGSYHGVSGTYNCTPTDGDTNCSASVAAKGFTLAGGTWTFKPTDRNARVMSTPDAIYASYGWWIHNSADGKTFTASAFVSDKGEVADASGITALRGTATYMGGAAGKYALYSPTGGTNDAGHFTARAMLEADFNADMISGTIDNFVGADGMSRNWSVKLNKTDISDIGNIDGTDPDNAQVGTVWTIGGTAAAKSGQWSGSLQDNGGDGVPKVGTGTFYSEYSTAGKMVGAFGVNKQ